jgi:hypothetical protein
MYANQLADLPAKAGYVPAKALSDMYFPRAMQVFHTMENWMNEGTVRYVTNPNLNTALIKALAEVGSGTATPVQALRSLNGIS